MFLSLLTVKFVLLVQRDIAILHVTVDNKGHRVSHAVNDNRKHCNLLFDMLIYNLVSTKKSIYAAEKLQNQAKTRTSKSDLGPAVK